MYKIIGADKAEYGPVSADTIRDWVKQGRINPLTQVQAAGSTEWRPLSAYPELSSALAASAAVPPPLTVGGAASGRMSGMAIASLVLGILGLFTFGLTALIGLVLGIVGLVKINNSRGTLKGYGVALAGTIVSGFFLLMLPIFAAMLLPALARAKGRAQSIVCMNNMKQLALGEIMYANDNKDRFSASETWCDAIGKYVPNPKTFQCPAGDASQRCHFAFNTHLAGIDTRNVAAPARTVLLFETDGGWNLGGGPELAIHRPRHYESIGVVFADGHCEIMHKSRFGTLRWDP